MTLTATSTLCNLFTIYIAGNPLIYSPAPRGTCSSCCPIREANDIKFLLYTRESPTKANQLYVNDVKRLENSFLNRKNPLALYIHGFSESVPGGEGQSSQEVRDAFINTGYYNVILVDWSPITATPWYSTSVSHIPLVGRYIARFIRFLINDGKFPVQNIHVIGFSLGAEIAGFVGQQLQEWNIKLPRITGLDPALPLFEGNTINKRLKSSDADFVDIIHTDGGILGNLEPMGDADFYPNGGTGVQPGCTRQELDQNRLITILFGCSHQRSWQYFIESIKRPKAFYAKRCEAPKKSKSCPTNVKAYMGLAADFRLRGKYFLDTHRESPFGRNVDSDI